MKRIRSILVAIAASLLWLDAHADNVVIKIATVAPPQSAWHDYLQQINEAWRQVSNGQVELKIYAGTLGDEGDIMRRIRIGQIDAATVSTVGLATIDPAATALHIPLAFSSYQEIDYVREHISAQVEQVLREKGIVVLNWGEGGWVRFFSNTPIQYPDDLKKQRLFIWSTGDTTQAEEIWKNLGVKPVPLSSVDMLPALQTGMITAYQAPPLLALANQWFAFTKFMTDMRWAPLLGASVISTRAWAQVPAELQPKLLQAAREAGRALDKKVRTQEQQAIDAMVKRGLTPVPISAETLKAWEKFTLAVYPEIRSKVVPAKYFDEALRLRDEYRATHAKAG